MFLISILFHTEHLPMYKHQKMQNIKEGAYLDYFKFFSINAAETIRKLETTIQDQLCDDVFYNPNSMFKRIKTLLSSYELLVLQIKDSCEFVEVPQFGICILKIFFQLMSIIKFMAKSIILRSTSDKPSQKEKRIDQRHTMLSPSTTPFSRNTHDFPSPRSKERQNFRIKEMASNMFKDLNKEVQNLQKQQKTMSLQNDNTFEKINRGRQKLQEIQTSQNQVLLSEAVSMLYKKGQHISNFINQMQTNMNLQAKEALTAENFNKLKELYDADSAQRFQYARNKLSELFKEYVKTVQRRKKQEMVNAQCQFNCQEQAGEQKGRGVTAIKKLSLHDQIKRLRSEKKTIEEENSSLKALIAQKTQNHQATICKIQSEPPSKVTSQSMISAKKSSRGTSKQVQSNHDALPNHDQQQNTNKCSDIKLQKEVRQKNNSGSKKIKHKIKLHQNSVTLLICSGLVDVIASFPSQANSDRNVLINQTLAFVQEETKQPHVSVLGDRVSQIPQMKQSKYEFQSSDQFILLQQKAKSLKKRYITRMSCGLLNWKREQTHHDLSKAYDSPLIRIKVGNDPNTKRQSIFAKQSCPNSNQQLFVKSRKQSVLPVSNSSLKAQLDDKMSIMKTPEPQSTPNPSSNFKIQKKQLIQAISNAVSSGSLTQKSKNKLIQMPVQTVIYKPNKKIIQFQTQDLITLFQSEDNAKNYQFLNLSLGSRTNQYLKTMGKKNIVVKQFKSLRVSRMNSSQNPMTIGHQLQTSQLDQQTFLINTIYQCLTTLKQSKRQCDLNNYHAIKNFIRFPHSSVYLKNDNNWKQLQKQNDILQYLDLKKYICRIMKLHHNCNTQLSVNPNRITSNSNPTNSSCKNILCTHWLSFLGRIGIDLPNQYQT